MNIKQSVTRITALFLTLYSALFGTVTQATAHQVTQDEALRQAKMFVLDRQAAMDARRKAPIDQGDRPEPQLSLAAKVGGLYLFNVAGQGGFVVVSNDTGTVPILGYSDSGTIDPDNIPDNMRAWLQGYADEIAWLQEHSDDLTNADGTQQENEDTASPAKITKEPISPLIETRWNQGAPYFNLTPYYRNDNGTYTYSTTPQSDYIHCATGCVATAMAQVMKYHEWPQRSTKIPQYTWKSYTLPELPAVTFNWDSMLDKYTSDPENYDPDQAAAIATLMKYCGWSVKMDYSRSSGAHSYDAATALKNYFDYNSTTTQYVQRSFYTYANWIELLYYELAHGRPVLYGGQSSGGGHEFVCDGYQGEDYFHINWGWGGTSDSYFKLSALDPDVQGIGGSSSTDGYHFGQDAVIGIQPSTKSDPIADIKSQWVTLSLNGVTFSDNPTQGEEVTVIADFKNTNSKDYDGDIGIRLFFSGSNSYEKDVCSTFFVPANTDSYECRWTVTPKNSGTYSVRVYKPARTAGKINYVNSTYYYFDVREAPGSDDIDLTMTERTIESPYEESKLYGTTLKASLTLANNNANTYSGKFGWILFNSDDKTIADKIVSASLLGGSSKSFGIDVTGLTIGETYTLKALFSQDGNMTEAGVVSFTATPAIVTFDPSGAAAFLRPSGDSFDASQNAPDALVVDVTGTDITDITPNSNANTLYIYSGTQPTGLDGKNVIELSDGKYVAQSIKLTDGNDFYSPVDFTADNIEFTYAFTIGADGINGWNSIMLPYDVTTVTADDNMIDWFHSDTDTGKNFWLKSFTGDEVGTVYFGHEPSTMKANTPYIVAFPGNRWGSRWDMSTKTIRFIGSGMVSKSNTVASTTGSYYRFIGSTTEVEVDAFYRLNAEGNAFILSENAMSRPFRAYFKPDIYDHSATTLNIGSGSQTGIKGIQDNSMTTAGSEKYIYDLQGRRIAASMPMKGLYIVNGKKVIK